MAMVMESQQPLAPPMPVVRAPPLPPPPPPPPLPPPPQAYKHRCRVCKKGFMCGRALGGHMRRHREEAAAATTAQAPPVLLQLFV